MISSHHLKTVKILVNGLEAFGGRKYGATVNIQCLYSLFNFTYDTNFLLAYIGEEDLAENYLMTLVEYQN
jgi:hypothetical protein